MTNYALTGHGTPVDRPAWLATVHPKQGDNILAQGFLWQPDRVVTIAHHAFRTGTHEVLVNGNRYAVKSLAAHPRFKCDSPFDACILVLAQAVNGVKPLEISVAPTSGHTYVWAQPGKLKGLGRIGLTKVSNVLGVLSARASRPDTVDVADSGGPWIDDAGKVFGITSRHKANQFVTSPVLWDIGLDTSHTWDELPKSCEQLA